MKYTINGKEYTEFDINKRCAELMGVYVEVKGKVGDMYLDKEQDDEYAPDINPADTWPIIEKCWDELMIVHVTDDYYARWDLLISQHNCTKLVAACICFIEINEGNESE